MMHNAVHIPNPLCLCMKNKELKTKEVATANSLSCYVAEVIAALGKEKKYSAAHNYGSALYSVVLFAESRDAPLPLDEVFTPEWLKAHEEWLTAHEYSPNTVSTYMRVLQAVYHRRVPTGTEGYNPLLFKFVHRPAYVGNDCLSQRYAGGTYQPVVGTFVHTGDDDVSQTVRCRGDR